MNTINTLADLRRRGDGGDLGGGMLREDSQQLGSAVAGGAQDGDADGAAHEDTLRAATRSATKVPRSRPWVRALMASRPSCVLTKRVPTRLSVVGPLTTSIVRPKRSSMTFFAPHAATGSLAHITMTAATRISSGSARIGATPYS